MKDAEKTDEAEKDARRGFDFIGVNVIFVCHDGGGKFLLHKRSKNCRDEQGRWDCGAGAIEFGETFEDAVRREVFEEYGTDPVRITYIDTQNIIRSHEGKTTHWLANLHLVQVDAARVKINDPHKMEEIGWFVFDNLPSPLHSEALRDIERARRFLS